MAVKKIIGFARRMKRSPNVQSLLQSRSCNFGHSLLKDTEKIGMEAHFDRRNCCRFGSVKKSLVVDTLKPSHNPLITLKHELWACYACPHFCLILWGVFSLLFRKVSHWRTQVAINKSQAKVEVRIAVPHNACFDVIR